jgi:hypothetical protein
MLNLLRDPIWGFIGTVLAVVFGIAGLVAPFLADRDKPSSTPMAAPAVSRVLWGILGIFSLGLTVFVFEVNVNFLQSPNFITLLGVLCTLLCILAAANGSARPGLLAVLIVTQLAVMIYALLGEGDNGGDYNILVGNAFSITSTLALIALPLLVLVAAIFATIVQAGRGYDRRWFALTLLGTLGAIVITLLVAISTAGNSDAASLPFALAILLTPLASELFAVYAHR